MGNERTETKTKRKDSIREKKENSIYTCVCCVGMWVYDSMNVCVYTYKCMVTYECMGVGGHVCVGVYVHVGVSI